jgi:5'-3' exonuclease
MGIPGMFLWLLKKNNNFINNKLDKQIDYLMLDLNSKIHPTCFKTIDYNHNINSIDKLEELMIEEIIKEINKLIDLIKPKISVYIAIDGVPPVAKMKQQRYRRFKTIADKKLYDNIKKKHNKPIENIYWNNSAITPGTIFMDKLHNRLLDYIKNKNIIYSSCYEPAEGEHKILQYIKSNLEYSYIIYGLDADLLFLSFVSQSEQIYLLRENEDNEFKYIDIKVMKDYIFNIIQNKISYNLNKKNIINDFIFICYLLGNDFIPHLYSIDIYDNNCGIDYILNIYTQTIQTIINDEYIINNDYTINMKFFIEFIKILSLNENNILKYNYYKKRKKIFFNKDKYENELMKIDNLLFKIDDPIKLGYDNADTINDIPGWRERYYKYYWNIENDELELFSKKLVEHYLRGLKWVTLYYFDKVPSWEWYFPFDFPPFISDIYKYYIDINTISFNIDTPLVPFMQLLIILPPQSSYLLPLSIQKIMKNNKSSLAYLYPIDFKQCFINKKKYWMGVPILPPLDIDLVKYIFNKYKNELSEEENKRNIIKHIEI